MEAIYSGYCNYGDELLSNVPYQRPVDNYYLDDIPYSIMEKINTVKFGKNEYSGEYEEEFSENYRKSVTFRKVADLHRYGYRMAKRKFGGDDRENSDVLNSFIEYWDTFCKNNSAADLYGLYRSVIFRIYKDAGVLSWTATFVHDPGIPIKEFEEPITKISSNRLN